MSSLKKLLGQTAVYGLSSIVGRLLNYLMVPLYTYNLPAAEYGMVIELYSYVALLFALLTYGMETTFFRFSETENDKKQVLSTSSIALLVSTFVFLIVSWFSRESIAGALGYEAHVEFVSWFIIIIAFDALTSIPFAWLRQQNKAFNFAGLKLINIFVNLSLNLFFILYCPRVMAQGESHWLYGFVNSIFNPEMLVSYVFISNLIASGITMAMMLPIYKHIKLGFNWNIWKRMMPYTLPVLVVNITGLIPISMDKILLPVFYSGTAEESMHQLGVYGANTKIAVIMLLFIQTFRYAADPFFFAESRNHNARETYAKVMHWFVIFGSGIFLATVMFLDVIKYFVGTEYRDGLFVIPILLMGNLILGVNYNLSFWYKLTNKTIYGAWFSIIGAVTSIALNIILVPRFGMMGSAWSVFAAYLIPTVLTYFYGKKYYPIPYKVWPMLLYPTMVYIIYYIQSAMEWSLVFRVVFFVVLGVSIVLYERRRKTVKA